MCNCIKAAINNGYVIRNSLYDEIKLDFVDGDEYYTPLYQRNDKGKPIQIKLAIKFCPICGGRLTGPKDSATHCKSELEN